MYTRSRYVLLLLVLTLLVPAGCDFYGGEDPPDLPSATSNAPAVIPIFLVNSEGLPLETFDTISDTTVLYDLRKPSHSILDPQGHSLTWDEFSTVTGSATVECVAGGTRTTVELRGLIPGGLYTIWNAVLHEPGFSGTLASQQASLVGVAPLGAPGGGENAFRASPHGTAQITGITPGGSTLRAPSPDGFIEQRGIEACALEEFELIIVGDYHYDGKTHGDIPGLPGQHVEQFGFLFRGAD